MSYVPTISTDNGMGCISTDGNVSAVFGENGIELTGDILTSPIVAILSQSGVSTTNPNGFNILNTLNMNFNDITNLNSITNNSSGLNITGSGDINLNAGADFVSLIGNKINLTANNEEINLYASNSTIYEDTTSVRIQNQSNTDAFINLDLSTQFPAIELFDGNGNTYTTTYNGDLTISANNSSNYTTQSLLTMKSFTDNVYLTAPSGKTYINKNGVGDGEIVAINFVGNLSGTASSATTATTASLATTITTTNTNANLSHYLNFSDSSSTGNGSVQKTAGISCNPSTNTITATTFNGLLSTGGLVYLSTGSQSITGSASATNINLTSIFNSTYKNYRILLYPTTQVSFTAYPYYALTAFLGTGTLPTTASLYGYEMISSATSVVSPIYTANATISSSPLILAVSQITNHQTIIEVENVGYSATASQSIGLKCKSIYNNPGVVGASDRTISAINISGSTITGITLQQSSISVGNNMTIGWTIYAYK